MSFFSPCTLPLVPGYLSVVTGGAVNDTSNRLKAFWLSLCFVLGFSLVFVALGASASMLGQWLMSYRQEANLIAGVLIVLMGLFMLYLAVYSLGLALPFVVTTMFIEHFRNRVCWFSRWSRHLQVLAGMVLVVMGGMVLTGQMTRFASWMLSVFPVLGKLG